MNTTIPDFTDAEQKLVSTALFERYDKLVPLQLADSELQLHASSDELLYARRFIGPSAARNLSCAKLLPTAFRCQFFYTESEHFGTGHDDTTVWATVS
jgi:hypothetical protein